MRPWLNPGVIEFRAGIGQGAINGVIKFRADINQGAMNGAPTEDGYYRMSYESRRGRIYAPLVESGCH